MSASDGVVAVVVTCNPEPNRMGLLLDALKNQVSRMVAVDNGSSSNSISKSNML